MRVATWNINSVKAHMEVMRRWLEEAQPDVVCLQEIKCETQNFPTEIFEELGFGCAVHGQKSYNGVALLSRYPLENIVVGLPGDETDEQARFIQATALDGKRAVTVASLYLPNGNPVDSPKFPYKLAWMQRLINHARALLRTEEEFVLAGDYNVIPHAIDAKHPEQWLGDALYQPQSRGCFQALLNLGLVEAYRRLHPAQRDYSFYDYQAGAWQKENGILIDHLLLSPQAADRLKDARIDKHVRGWEKPSDHIPVVITI